MSSGALTAVFGGRFDPPHLGHVEAVRGLFKNPGVARVLILPSPTPPHKPAVASPAHRLEMTRLAFEGDPQHGDIEIDLREFTRALAHPHEPTYSFDTLSEMRREFGDRLAFVIGTDQLENLRNWHRFPEILGLCHWIVLERKPETASARPGLEILSQWQASGLVERAPGSKWRLKPGQTTLTLVETLAPAVSSTAIREAVARTGHAPAELVPPRVNAYLKIHRLYGSKPASAQ